MKVGLLKIAHESAANNCCIILQHRFSQKTQIITVIYLDTKKDRTLRSQSDPSALLHQELENLEN